MSDHDQSEQIVTAYLLGDADGQGEARARMHIEACASCRSLARRLSRVTGALPLAAEPTPAPARLRSRILAAASATPQMRSSLRSAAVVEIPARRLSGWRRLPAPATGLAAAVAVVLAIAGSFAWSGHSQPPPSPVARFTMTGTGSLRGAQATVVDLRQDGVVLVDFKSMPAVGRDRVYELWLITAQGRADPAGVFRPQPDGSYVLVLTRPLSGYREAGVTVEQGPNGTRLPSQAPHLSGTIR